MKLRLLISIAQILSVESYGQISQPIVSEVRIPCVTPPSECKVSLIQTSAKRSLPCRPILFANKIIVRQDELKPDLIDNAFAENCTEAFPSYGEIEACGIISLNTRQSIKSIAFSEIALDKSNFKADTILYFINGLQRVSSITLISVKAIKKIEVFNIKPLEVGEQRQQMINIWTLTKKERKRIRNEPKDCQGIIIRGHN